VTDTLTRCESQEDVSMHWSLRSCLLKLLIKVTQSLPLVGVCITGVLKKEFLPVTFLPQSSMLCSSLQTFEQSAAYSALRGRRDGVIVLSAYCFAQL